MMRIIRTNSTNADFRQLVNMLDEDLALRDGDEHAFYAQFNKIDNLKHAVVLWENQLAVGCGAIKQYDAGSAEVKRMFVLPVLRGKGFAMQILHELETWASELGYARCVLETGLKQPEAIRLYTKAGYKRIANYGQYAGVENSVCMEKVLDAR